MKTLFRVIAALALLSSLDLIVLRITGLNPRGLDLSPFLRQPINRVTNVITQT
jgi:hypothetical protein